MDSGFEGLQLAHALINSDTLILQVIVAMCATYDFFKTNRDRRSLFKGCEKVLVTLNVPGQLVNRNIRQFFSLGLRHIKNRYHLISGYGNFLFLHDRFSVFPHNRLSCMRVDFLRLLFYLERRRGNNLDTLFAFYYVTLKVIFPSSKSCHKGSVGLLHGDKQRIVKAVIVEAGHNFEIFFVAFTVKEFCNALLQTVGNLFHLFCGFFACQHDRDNRAGLLRLYGCRRGGLFCGGCVHKNLVLFALFRLRITHNAVFLRQFAPLKMAFPFVAAFHKVAIRGKAALLLLGSIFSKSSKVNAVFPFFGHLHHAGFVKVIVAQVAGRVHSGDMYEIIHVVSKINYLSDIFKSLFLLQGCVELWKLCGVKLCDTRCKKIKAVNVSGAYHVIG